MAVTSIHRNYLSFFREVTPCVAPADWNADGTAIEFTSLDLSGVKQSILDNPTLERRGLSVNKRKKIKGIRNCEFSVGLKLHGTGVVTADGDTVEETYLGTLLKHSMGGLHLGTSTNITGGTATVPILDDVAGIIPGQMLAFEDITSPTSKYAGKPIPRRVLSVDGDTGAVTLSEALPFTPANTDKVHGGETNYNHEGWLEDAVAAGGTMMWYAQKHYSATDLVWQIEGSVASFALTNLSRGQLPGIDFKCMGANFKHGADDGLVWKSLPSPQGQAQLSNGMDLLCSIGVYGNTARNDVDVNQASFDVGYQRVRVETTTENIDRFEGTASYSFQPGNTRFTITLIPYANSWYAGLADGQEYRITFFQPGDGSGAGKLWCLHIPRAQLVETPSRQDVNEINGIQLVFEAMEPDDADVDANEELEKSLFLLFRA